MMLAGLLCQPSSPPTFPSSKALLVNIPPTIFDLSTCGVHPIPLLRIPSVLDCSILSGKCARWVVILQEFDLKFVTPKSKKGLVLTELISELPTDTQDPPINDALLDEHLFAITTDDPWYSDIITYLRTQKFALHLDRDAHDVSDTKPLATF